MLDIAGEQYGDQKRKQVFFHEVAWKCEAKDFVKRIKEKLKTVLPQRIARDHVFLFSEDGCADQQKHADWDINSFRNNLIDDGVCGGYPMGCLLALEPDTFFNVWPGSIDFTIDCFYDYQRLGKNHKVEKSFFFQLCPSSQCR